MRAAIALLGLLTVNSALSAPLESDNATRDIEFASLTLRVHSQDVPVEILDQHNLTMRLVPADYQGTPGLRAFAIECAFQPNYRVSVVDARLDDQFHLIPADVLDYSNEFPSGIKLQFSTLYFENKINVSDPGTHTLFIRFFTHPN